jgi:hypothetical protein
MKFRYLLLMGAALGSMAMAADPGLLSLVPPDAKAVAGIQADQARNSLFGQYVLSRMQAGGVNFDNFIATTGFDPREDLSEILLASNGAGKTSQNHWLAAGKGVFDIQKLTAAALAHGGTLGSFNGVAMVTYPARGNSQVPSGFAFLDASTGILGDTASVRAAIQQWQNGAPPNSALLDKVNQASANEDFWFVTLVPPSQFPAAVARSANSGAANILAAVNQLSGGVRFGDTVTVSAQAVARSDKDAQSLADVLKFFAGMVQLNSQNNPAAGRLSALLDSLNTQTSGNVATFSLAVSEQELEQFFATARPGPRRRPRTRLQVN